MQVQVIRVVVVDDHALHRTPGQGPTAGTQLHEQSIIQNSQLLPFPQPGFEGFTGGPTAAATTWLKGGLLYFDTTAVNTGAVA